jgi:hypothetical protein
MLASPASCVVIEVGTLWVPDRAPRVGQRVDYAVRTSWSKRSKIGLMIVEWMTEGHSTSTLGFIIHQRARGVLSRVAEFVPNPYFLV